MINDSEIITITNKKIGLHLSKDLKSETVKCIQMVINKRQWKEVTDDACDIFWSRFMLSDKDRNLALKTIYNRIPGMSYLTYKRENGYYLKKYEEYYPESFDFNPKTFLIPGNVSELKEFYIKNKCLFIAKPTAGSLGEGIILIKDLNDLDNLLNSSDASKYGYAIQQYINNPLLIDNKKFDLRLYVLISSINPLIVYLNEEGLARFCTEDYLSLNENNLNNMYMHLSNYSLNKNNKNYIYSEECEGITKGSKRTMASFWKSIQNNGIDKDKIISNIEDLIHKFFAAMHPLLSSNEKVFFGDRIDQNRCFQIVGLDILIDENLKPWLMEINANPSIAVEHNSNMSPVDWFVNEKVVEHAIEIVMMKKNKQMSIGLNKCFKSYKMILDGKSNLMQKFNIFSNLITTYDKLSRHIFKSNILSIFSLKFFNIPNIYIDKYFDRNNYDSIYKFHDKRICGFYDFINIIESLVKKLYPYENFEVKKVELVTNFINLIANTI